MGIFGKDPRDRELRLIVGGSDEAIRDSAARERREMKTEPWRNGVRKGIAAVAIAAGVGAGGFVIFKAGEFAVNANRTINEQNAAKWQYEIDLTSVETLKKNGACADELLAQAEVEKVNLSHAKDNENKDIFDRRVNMYTQAAMLSELSDVSCVPSDPGATSMTPIFEVTALMGERLCADELLTKKATIGDPSNMPNEYLRETAEVQVAVLQQQANLAKTYAVPCS